MKRRKLLTSITLSFWFFSSFASGPSRTIQMADSFGTTELKSVREVLGMDVEFSGKMAGSHHGHLMLLLEAPVVWTYLDVDGNPASKLVSVVEVDPTTNSAVDAYLLSVAESEADEDAEVQPVSFSDLEFNSTDGSYLAIDSDKSSIYAFEYGPDQEVTVMVEKTRMVEVVIPPESLLAEIEGSDSDVTESESTDTDNTVEEAEAAEIVDTALDSPSENLVEETADPVEGDIETTAVEPEADATEPEVLEVAIDESEADPTSVSEEMETEDSPAEVIAVVPEAEQTIDVIPVEVPEIIEEIEEEIVTKTKWVEESYEEAITVMEPHKFGNALSVYSVADLELNQVVDLYFDPVQNRMMALGQDEEDQWVLKGFEIEAGFLQPVGESLTFDVDGEIEAVFVDSLTQHWVIVSDNGVDMYARDGRLLRNVVETASIKDVVEVGFEDVDPTIKPVAYLAKPSSFGKLDWTRDGEATVHHVPGEFTTIQSAVDAAASGDWILLSPGQYEENVIIDGKEIQFASYYVLTEELYFLEQTVIAPASGIGVKVTGTEGSSAFVSGLRFSGAEIGIQSSGNLTVEHSEFLENQAGMSLGGGTAMIADCQISDNSSVGIAYRDATATLLERCDINNNSGNGIEIDITPYTGVLYRTVIRRNTIQNNEGSGIYFNDQPITTQREFRIENNFILNNGEAGAEVYLDQPDPENLIPTGPRTRSSVYLVNNTIVGNPVGVLRGGNFRAINNIIAQSSVAGIKDLRYNSAIIRNLFWENEENAVESNFNASNNREEDPLFVGDDYILSVRSPAKRSGIPGNLWNDSSDRSGADIGASR